MTQPLQNLVWKKYQTLINHPTDITELDKKIAELVCELVSLSDETDRTIPHTNTEALLQNAKDELVDAEKLYYDMVRWYPTGQVENMKRTLLREQKEKILSCKTSVDFYQVLHDTPKPEPKAYRAHHMKNLMSEIGMYRNAISTHEQNVLRLDNMKAEIIKSFE